MSASNTSTFNLGSVLEKEMLNGTNFIDWYCNLRIVLEQPYPDELPLGSVLEKEMLNGMNFINWYCNLRIVLEQPYPDELPDGATAAARRAYEKHCNDSLNVSS
jgi:hypothetical protein